MCVCVCIRCTWTPIETAKKIASRSFFHMHIIQLCTLTPHRSIGRITRNLFQTKRWWVESDRIGKKTAPTNMNCAIKTEVQHENVHCVRCTRKDEWANSTQLQHTYATFRQSAGTMLMYVLETRTLGCISDERTAREMRFARRERHRIIKRSNISLPNKPKSNKCTNDAKNQSTSEKTHKNRSNLIRLDTHWSHHWNAQTTHKAQEPIE